MRLLVLLQVVTPHKSATTLRTGVGLLAGMCPDVSVEVILPLKPLVALPAAEGPVLNELRHAVGAGAILRR